MTTASQPSLTDAQAEGPARPPAVGSQMVIEALGTSPQRLARLHKTDSTEGVAAWLVAWPPVIWTACTSNSPMPPSARPPL